MKKNINEQELTAYGDFLLRHSMVQPGREKYFVSWLRRYLNSEHSFKGQAWQDKLPQYLDLLARGTNIMKVNGVKVNGVKSAVDPYR